MALGCTTPPPEVRSARPPVGAAKNKSDSPGPGAPIAIVPGGTVGPFLCPSGEGWLVVWAEPDGARAHWFVRSVDEKGAARGEPDALALALGTVGLVRFRAHPSQGAVVLFTARAPNDGTVDLHALLLDDAGQLRAPPVRVADDIGDVVWVDVANIADRAIAVWAERKGARADLFSTSIGSKRNEGKPELLREGVNGWQLAGARGSALLAVVSTTGAVTIDALNQSGTVQTSTIVTDSGAEANIDLASTLDGFVLAFTTRRRLSSRVVTALVGDDGNLLTQPAPAAPALGSQSLVGLTGGNPATVAFRNEEYEPDTLRVASLSKAGLASNAETLFPLDPSLPEPQLAERPSGGVSSLLWACTDSAGCLTPKLPTLINLDRKLVTERVATWDVPDTVPDLAWDLQCGPRQCAALVANFGESTRVFLHRATPPTREWVIPVKAADARPPRLVELEAVFETAPLADAAAVPSRGGTLISTLTDFDDQLPYEIPDEPAPDGRKKPVRAVLSTQWLPPTREWLNSDGAAPEPIVISYRARSVSGLALASKGERNLLAWSAIDGDQPQVFTTLVDAGGKKLTQHMQTRSPGEVRHVVVASARRGWLLGWIDERSGQPRAYATRLEDNANRRTGEVAIASSATCSGLDVQAVGDEMWLLVAESEGDQHRLRLHRTDDGLRTIAEPVTLTTSSTSISNPKLLLGSNSRWAAWAEANPEASRPSEDGASGKAPRVRWVPLSSDGQSTASPSQTAAQGEVVQITGACADDACGLLIGERGERHDFFAAVTLGPKPEAHTLLRLLGRRADVGASLLADELWFHDDLGQTSRRGVKAGEVRWRD